MKKDKIHYMLFLLMCIMQCFFFKEVTFEEIAYAYVYGVDWEGDVLQIFALIMPIFMMLIFFCDYYVFYLENYGRLLLIRHGSRMKILGKIYSLIVWKLLILVGIQFFTNIVFFGFLPMKTVIPATIIYFIILVHIILIEILICNITNMNSSLLITFLYVMLQCIISFMSKNTDLKKIMYLGKMVDIEKIMLTNCYGEMIIIVLLSMVVVAITYIVYRKKDIL